MRINKIFINVAILISSSVLFGQTTKQIDYFKTLSLNLSDLQDYMIQLNFQFNGTQTDTLGQSYVWAYNVNRNNAELADCFYNVYYNNDGSKSIAYSSGFKNDYQKFKILIKSKNLKYNKSENYENKLVEYYSNSKYEAKIWTYLNSFKKRITYEMCLQKK